MKTLTNNIGDIHNSRKINKKGNIETVSSSRNIGIARNNKSSNMDIRPASITELVLETQMD